MNSIIGYIEELKKSGVSKIIKKRIKEFESFKNKDSKEWFLELCFCILTANSSANLGITAQKEIGYGFLFWSREKLEKKLKELGHRFYRKRAEYIVLARRYAENLKEIVENFKCERKAREWLVKNIKGIGYKEASHFLRNVGYKNVAIIDRHILNVLSENGIIKKPKTLTKRRYLEIEKKLEEIAERVNLSLAELDLYLWYMKTRKVLK